MNEHTDKPSTTDWGLDLASNLPVSHDTPELSKLKVLIVDDEPMLRSVIQDFLLMLGFTEQRVAGDGIEALEVIRSEPIDFMLSDIRMPKMELEELLGVIKKEFPGLIVVATSGFSDLESARNIFIKGAHDFIGKPLNLDALELALQWIVERQQVLAMGERLFGQSALPVPPEESATRIQTLRDALGSGTHHFGAKIRHSIRMSDLIPTLQTGLEPPQQLDLQVAALLHELGTGYQIQALCRQPRSLDDDERRLVQEHAQISGRLAAWSLGRPEFMPLIGHHLDWPSRMTIALESWTLQDRLAVWLGVLNTLDGYLHDRPDRPAVSTRQVQEIFSRKWRHAGPTPVACLLDQWSCIEAFFS